MLLVFGCKFLNTILFIAHFSHTNSPLLCAFCASYTFGCTISRTQTHTHTHTHSYAHAHPTPTHSKLGKCKTIRRQWSRRRLQLWHDDEMWTKCRRVKRIRKFNSHLHNVCVCRHNDLAWWKFYDARKFRFNFFRFPFEFLCESRLVCALPQRITTHVPGRRTTKRTKNPSALFATHLSVASHTKQPLCWLKWYFAPANKQNSLSESLRFQ